VNIARLRLWLSLIVDYTGATPPPLPNLDFKIEQGDSLLAASPEAAGQLGMRDQLVPEFQAAKARYARAHGEDKRIARAHVEELYAQIAQARYFGKSTGLGFDWAVAFAEVFSEGGFDIVLANPPYVRQELIKELKPALKKVFPEVYNGTADLYCYFYARALQLLKPNGMLAFISPNKWFRSKYGVQLRGHIASTCCINEIIDFGELPVFEAAATFPMVFIARKGRSVDAALRFTQVPSLGAPYPDLKALTRQYGYELPTSAIAGSRWLLTDLGTAEHMHIMDEASVPLRRYVTRGGWKIHRGLMTGLNKAFVLDSQQREALVAKEPRSAEVIKPLAVGDDVRRWHIRPAGEWLIVLPIGTNISHYKAVLEHLSEWQDDLEARGDRGVNWWELRPCTYYHLFEKPKILFPDFAMEPRATLDVTGHYTLNTTYLIPSDDLFLLGVLNSSSIWHYVKERLAVFGNANDGGRLRFFSWIVQELPIPRAEAGERKLIADLVQRCLDGRRQGEDVRRWEFQINEHVAKLYGVPVPQARGDGVV